MRTFSTFPLLSLLALALACGGKGDESTKTATKTDTKTETKTAATTPEKAAEPAKPVEMIEHDLGGADPEWAGWIAKGPKDVKVMADGVKGARLAGGGMDGFDLAFAPKKTDLAELKKNLEIGAEKSEGKVKLTFTAESDDALEWTSEAYGSTTYNFVIHMTADDREITCKNNYMIGISSTEALERHKEACKTLQQRAAE